MTDVGHPDQNVPDASERSAAVQMNRSFKVTAGARFNASKRLEHVDSRLTFLTAITSATIIALTVWPRFVPIDPQAAPWVELFTVALSVLLLASSLLQYSQRHAVKAELYHRSALDIQELRRELQYKMDRLSLEDFSSLSERYNAILQRYNLNHADVDFYRYQIEWPETYQLGWREKALKELHVWNAYNYPFLILFATVLLSITIMFMAHEFQAVIVYEPLNLEPS